MLDGNNTGSNKCRKTKSKNIFEPKMTLKKRNSWILLFVTCYMERVEKKKFYVYNRSISTTTHKKKNHDDGDNNETKKNPSFIFDEYNTYTLHIAKYADIWAAFLQYSK